MKSRLALLVVGTMCLVLAAFLVPLAMLVRTMAVDKAMLAATAEIQGVALLVATPTERSRLEHVALSTRRPVTVFLPDGAQVGAPAEVTPPVRLAMRGESLTAVSGSGLEVVIAVQGRPEGTAVVRTLVTEAEMTAGVRSTWYILAGLAATLVLLGVVVAYQLARTLVAPIADLSAVSHRLARGELTARARPAGPPELRKVGRALNHLAERIQVLLREEREQVADLSHRLRTPLTVLRLEAESLSRPGDAARVTEAVDALEGAVTALIQQARRRHDRAAVDWSCDATAVVRDRVAFWAVLAEDTDRDVALSLPMRPVPVAVDADDLAAALDALLGNVFAHTPDGTALEVVLTPRPGGAVLAVTDDGPGFGDVGTTPLHRGTSGAGSTGLGLDIARRTAQNAGGALHLGLGPGGGARVTMELAAPGTERWMPAHRPPQRWSPPLRT